MPPQYMLYKIFLKPKEELDDEFSNKMLSQYGIGNNDS